MAEIPDYVVRQMTIQDFEQVLQIYNETGMSLSNDLNTWFNVDPRGMFVASTKEGYILGSCSAIFFKEDLSFFGLYAVREVYRGQGIGGKILKATQDYVAGRNCALNTAEVHLITYRDRAGFKLQSGIISLECIGTDGKSILENCQQKLLKNDAVQIVPVDAKSVVQYDALVHGYNRELLVTLSLEDPDCFALSAVDYKGKVKGYGMIKKDIGGIAILGPLYADDQLTAENLTRELVAKYEPVRDNGLVIMALKSNPGSVEIIEKLNLKVTEVYERLFTNKIVTIPNETKVYSQHSFDFCNY